MNTPQPVIVRAGDVEPRGAFGLSLSMLTIGEQSVGQWLLIECLAPARCVGPPSHYHRLTTELVYVLDGTLTLAVGTQSVRLAPGSSAYLPPGVVHALVNETDTPARFLQIASPAGLERCYAELGELLGAEGDWSAGGSDLLALMAKYDCFPPP
ncbi:MAG: cupin domain-containing protein [Thermomicrobiales bacterium]